ncbi:MAG: dihydrofolate reductase [Fimbriimonadaceae bacterium]|nr:dihydrofolate reductase [Chitinophagales bacterium]
MGKLIVYNFVSLNGYYKGLKDDISWAKSDSKGEQEFAAENLKSGNILLFGRVTYEMMAGYWPLPDAAKNNPLVADGMNKAEKIVFSKTLKNAEWNNTRIIKDNMEEEIKKLKETSGKDMTLLGSGSIVTQFADMGLIDEFQIMVHPVAITEGTPILKDIKQKLELKLTSIREFKSGVVLHCYQPMKK